MDPAKIREALGLTSDASDDEVRTAVAAAGFAPPTPPAGNVAASSDPAAAATAARGGLITIDPAQLEQFNAAMVRAAALDERLKKQDRDSTIKEAVRVGKFPPARKAHYEKLWDIDPVGTREVIASLAAGLIPVTASGYDTDADDTNFADAEYEHLFPPVRREASRG